MSGLFHSVYLNHEKCKGCTTCLRSCPTGAIRVRRGKAKIIETKCIDCGVCIRKCPHGAKLAKTDDLASMKPFKHKTALIAPTLLGQFKRHWSVERILEALELLGFDDAYEVAYGADIIGRSLYLELQENPQRPIISSACPAVTKLIQVRFPELVQNISLLKTPMVTTTGQVRRKIRDKTGLDNKDIGVFFISPCPAKATEALNTIISGNSDDVVNGTISIRDVYPKLLSLLRKTSGEARRTAPAKGFGWALSGGEASYLEDKRVLHVDGISNVAAILDEIENGRLGDIDFFEGLACTGGCVGGCLTVENNYIAAMNIQDRKKACLGPERVSLDEEVREQLFYHHITRYEAPLVPREMKPLDSNMAKAIAKMKQIEEIENRLPGLDCGSCGAPGCRALAEDIVTGHANEMDCVFRLKERLRDLTAITNEILQSEHPMEGTDEVEKKALAAPEGDSSQN